jgi:hypothetical protein
MGRGGVMSEKHQRIEAELLSRAKTGEILRLRGVIERAAEALPDTLDVDCLAGIACRAADREDGESIVAVADAIRKVREILADPDEGRD